MIYSYQDRPEAMQKWIERRVPKQEVAKCGRCGLHIVRDGPVARCGCAIRSADVTAKGGR